MAVQGSVQDKPGEKGQEADEAGCGETPGVKAPGHDASLGPRVLCVFSPDGSTIASACFDGTVRLLDAKKMEGKGMLTGHRGKVKCVAYSPDGKRIASAGSDKTVRVWDAATMEEVCSVKGHSDYVRCVAYSPDG
eukprot:CAMPEP_0173418424 /NCGR_PEP_ID=MMETSP1357-20121228/586_1 /TAXON_ID=77926 /ORGANISM="Hemiselmis rufescens, Strain PCC563" /LENGTH=134 /DNA_ID=CAMNT_0014380913 /DNA_START=14 /DNA_END=415 /DNA_ORIENTATION=-